MATNQKIRAQRNKENRDTRPHAKARYIRISARKVKVVIDLIRGKNVNEAQAILMYTPKAAAEPVLKLLKSAIANAEDLTNNGKGNYSTDMMYVDEVYADQGPTLKRFRPRAQGRASRICKRTSHITIVLNQAK